MSETDLKVQIRFEATGDKELAKAFTSAANAQKKLEDVTKKYEAAQRKSNKQTDIQLRNLSRLGGSLGKIRVAFAKLRSQLLVYAFAVNFVQRTVGRAVDAFSEQQVVVAKLEQTLRSTAFASRLSSRELQGLAANLQKLTGIGDETIISMQGILLTFTKIKGQIFKDATEAIIDVSVAMGQDLQQSAIQVGKALNDPITGVSALSRVGIQFTDTQKEMIKLFVKQNKIAEAQTIILDELRVQFGGTAKNLDTTTKAVKRLQAEFGDLLETQGGKLAPFVEDISNFFADFIESLNSTQFSRGNRIFSMLTEENKKFAIQQEITNKSVNELGKEFGLIGLDMQNRTGFKQGVEDIDNKLRELMQNKDPLVSFFNEIVIQNLETGTSLQDLTQDTEKVGQAIASVIDKRFLVKDFLNIFKGDLDVRNFTKDLETFTGAISQLDQKFLSADKTELLKDLVGIFDIVSDGIDATEFDELVSKFRFLNAEIITANGNFSVFAPIINSFLEGTLVFNDLTEEQIQKLRELKEQFIEGGAAAGNYLDTFIPFSQKIENFNKAAAPVIKGFDQMASAGMLFTKNNKELTISLLKLRQALAIGNVILGFTEFLSKGMYAKAFSTLATGMTQVAQIKAQIESAREAATGADFVTSGRQLLMVGDNPTGRERVQVTPLGNSGGGGGGDSSVTINLNGNILGTEDFVRDELIPQIENAVGRNLA